MQCLRYNFDWWVIKYAFRTASIRFNKNNMAFIYGAFLLEHFWQGEFLLPIVHLWGQDRGCILSVQCLIYHFLVTGTICIIVSYWTMLQQDSTSQAIIVNGLIEIVGFLPQGHDASCNSWAYWCWYGTGKPIFLVNRSSKYAFGNPYCFVYKRRITEHTCSLSVLLGVQVFVCLLVSLHIGLVQELHDCISNGVKYFLH